MSNFYSKLSFTLLLALVTLVGWGQAVNEGFESTSLPPSGWTYNSITHGTNNPRTGSRCATLNGSGDALTSPLVSNPDTLSFWYRRSSNTTAWGVSVEVLNSSNTVIATLTAVTSATTTYQQYTANLSSYSNIKIRITDTRASGTVERYIDDFSITVPTSFTVTFNGNGSTGGTMTNQTASTATNLTANAYTRTGYTFDEWNTVAGGSGTAYADGASFPFTANDTLYAQWTPNNNTITFDGNGATGGSTATQTLATAATANLNANGYTRTGYVFDGWATSSGGSVAYADGASFTMGTSNVTLYAVWSLAGSFTVTFDANGGSGSMSNQTASSATNLNSNAFTRTGYTFANWNTIAGGGGTTYADGASYTFTANVTLYAQWTPNNNTITFDGNGSTGGSTTTQTLATAATANLNTNGYTRAGYTFAGWATSAGGSVVYADGASYTMGTSNVTLYAKWTPNNYIITFDGNGATSGSTSSQTIASGSSATLNTNGFLRTGYTFAGWNTVASGSGTSYPDGASYTMGTSNVTLYAQWNVYVPPCLSENFSGGFRPTGWSDSGTGITYSSNYADMSVSSGTITMIAVANPNSLTFDLSRTTNTTAKNLNIEVSTTSSTSGFSTVTNYDHSNTTSGGTTACTVDLSAYSGNSLVYIRFNKTSGSTSPWRIDNIEVYCNALPEINITGNNVSILNNDNSPSLSDFTDFGSTTVLSGTINRVYRIKNIGSDTLFLNGTSPFVAISGTHASDFTLTSTPSSTILTGDSTSFQITFDPSAVGTRTATISIDNNDSDEDPYTFDISGVGTNSNTSDIIESSGFSYSSNHDYTAFQAATITSTSNSVGVFRFEIRDGAGSSDADALGTELNSITFNVGTTNINYIRSAALFDGSAMRNNTPTINTGAGTITFSGLSGTNFSAPDNGSLTLTLRISYLTTVVDNAQIQYTISSASASTAGSVFASADAGGASSSITSDRNRLEVTADRIAFVQQPSSVSTGANMAPAPTVAAVDANGNRDLDFAGTLTMSSTGSPSSQPSASASSGLATFSSVNHSTAATARTLTVNSSGLAFSNTITSNTFDITTIVYNAGDYRSVGSGTWANGGASTLWERFDVPSPGWNSGVNAPNYNTTNAIYIQNGHTITSGGSFGNSVQLFIMDGGIFNCNHSGTTGETYIYDGGTLNVNASFTIASAGTFEVEDGGMVNIDFRYGTPSSSIFQGTEIFHPNSTFTFIDWDAANDNILADNTSVSTNAFNGYTAAFGNLIFDFDANLGSSDDLIVLASGVNINLAHGDVILRTNSTSTADFRLSTTGTVTSGIGGNFIVEDTYGASNNINLKTSGTLTFTISGDMILDAASTRIFAGSAATGTTLNVLGDVNVNASAVLDFNSTVSATPSATLNLSGNLFVAGSGLLHNTNTSNFGNLNFVGDTIQTIDIASTSANENRNLNFNVKNGAYVQLINRNFELGRDSKLTVEDGGTFDFGFNGTTPLLVAISGTQTGTTFESLQGSTLKITSPDGITTTSGTGAGIGNVQVPASNRSYNQVATFWYIGKVNQVTGNGITTGSSGKIIICDLIDNNTQLSFTNSTGITNNTAVSATGGKLDIRKGQVIESTTAFISGSTGTLYMEPGTLYQIAKGSSSATDAYNDLIPRVIGGTFPYILNGGTIELNGTGSSDAFQVLRGSQSRPNYINIKYSGANTLGTDYKALSTATVIDSLLIITGSTVVDCINSANQAASFTGAGALVMDGGRLRIKKLNDANPELDGTAMDYNLTGGTVEFYGTSNTQQQKIRGSYGSPSKTIQYFNVDVNAVAGNYTSGANGGNVDLNESFTIQGAVNVNSPAVLRMDAADFIYKFTGNTTNSVNINDGAGLYYGSPFGITTVAQGGTGLDPDLGSANPSAGNIRTNNRTFSSLASYGFVSASTMASGSGLPSNIVSLYVNRNSAGNLVNLTNSVTLSDTLKFQNAGIVVTGTSNTIFVNNTSIDAVKGGAVSGTDKYVQGRLQRKINSGSTYSFPIGHSSQNAQGFSITPTGTNGSDILGFLEANSSSPMQPRAYCDLEIKTAAGQQIGQGTAGTDGALDLVTFNLASPLQWDVTNPGGGVTSYDITVNANGGQDISPVTSAGGTAIRYLMKNGEPGNTGVSTGTGGADYPSTGFLACPNGYTLSGMTSFSDFTLDGANASNTGLPVVLTYFTARKEGETSILNWMTSLEIDNDRFEIERKTNQDFEYIGKVNGNGNSTSPIRYQFVDETPVNSWNYYRLKQVDFDGKFEYSNIVALYFDNNQEISISFYPNPVNNNLFVSVNNKDAIIDAALYNSLGQEIRKIKIDTYNDVSDLSSGSYVIKVNAGLQVITKQFVKF